MLTKSRIQDFYKKTGPNFAVAFRHHLGLCDESGQAYRDQNGVQTIRESKSYGDRLRPDEISIRALAEGLVGESWAESMNPQNLLEAGGVDPTQFAHITAFNSAIGGAIELKILEGFKNPLFIMDQVFQTVSTKFDGERLGRIGMPGDKAKPRKPGMPTNTVGLDEGWVDTPRTEENALACEVTKEAVYFDRTNTVLQHASSVGEELGYRKELRQIDVFLGIVNPYEYNDTGYSTYQTATPWINSHVNALADYTDIENGEMLFAQMTDPISGKRVLLAPDLIVTVPSLKYTMKRILNSTEVAHNDGASNTFRTASANPIDTNYKVLTSPLIHQRALAADGLNLNEANSKRWYQVCKGAFVYMENWGLVVAQAAPGQVEMLSRGIASYYHANERGVPTVQEPRKAVENKAA